MRAQSDVSEVMASLDGLRSLGLVVHPERCVRVRNRHSSCRRCALACTSGAIACEEGAWTIDPDKCVRCGTCATLCPTGALEPSHPRDAELVAAALAASCEGATTFRCQAAVPDAADAAEVVCLSRLDETLLFELAARGIACVRLRHGDCASCPRANGVNSMDAVAETAAALSDAWGIPLTVERIAGAPRSVCDKAPGAETTPVETVPVSATSKDFVPVHVMKDGTLPHFVPARRGRLLDALARGEAAADAVLESRLWGHVAIDEGRCTSCRMCAVFCPTGALSRYGDEEAAEMGIEHYAAECVQCNLCQDICPAHAIHVEHQVPLSMLAAGETERHPMAPPQWSSGPDQILRRMEAQISGNAVSHSY